MGLVYTYDLIPSFISIIVFSILSTAHRVLLPNKYSSFLQFKSEENPQKTAESTAIRIVYLILGTIFLYQIIGFSEKQILIGIFISCFLNIWPAIIQYQLLRIIKSKTEWLLLLGYILFIGFSVFVAITTIRMLLPILIADRSIFLLGNQGISILITLITIAIPIPIEAIIAKFTHIVIVQKIDTFKEEIYIIQRQVQMDNIKIDKNKYLIDDVAKENDINVCLLYTIIKLEMIYRERLYYKILEYIACKVFRNYTIKKDFSVGLAQIKVSTAQKVLRKNPKLFVSKLVDDEFNINVCGKIIRCLIDEYNNIKESREVYLLDNYEDIYDYIACEYLGGLADCKERTILIYSAVLRSIVSDIYYAGSDERDIYHIKLYNNKRKLSYDEYNLLKEKFQCFGTMIKEVYENGKIELTVRCLNKYKVEDVRNLAKEEQINSTFV